jgi:hypothetical protein
MTVSNGFLKIAPPHSVAAAESIGGAQEIIMGCDPDSYFTNSSLVSIWGLQRTNPSVLLTEKHKEHVLEKALGLYYLPEKNKRQLHIKVKCIVEGRKQDGRKMEVRRQPWSNLKTSSEAGRTRDSCLFLSHLRTAARGCGLQEQVD